MTLYAARGSGGPPARSKQAQQSRAKFVPSPADEQTPPSTDTKHIRHAPTDGGEITQYQTLPMTLFTTLQSGGSSAGLRKHDNACKIC